MKAGISLTAILLLWPGMALASDFASLGAFFFGVPLLLISVMACFASDIAPQQGQTINATLLVIRLSVAAWGAGSGTVRVAAVFNLAGLSIAIGKLNRRK